MRSRSGPGPCAGALPGVFRALPNVGPGVAGTGHAAELGNPVDEVGPGRGWEGAHWTVRMWFPEPLAGWTRGTAHDL